MFFYPDGKMECQPRIMKVPVTSWIKRASSQKERFDYSLYKGDDKEVYEHLFKFANCLIYEREDI